MTPNKNIIVTMVSVPSLKEGRALARRLIDQKLAACVSLVSGVESHYRWQGRAERSRELLMLIKTQRTAWPALRDLIADKHSYSVPEIVAWPLVWAHGPYARWVASEIAGNMEPKIVRIRKRTAPSL
ncbi:MAG: divalent-cation tolerance protein CutA [Elusimicrobia bacterium]|nr:divalent-cation tolerance protein CutA [Elusimicrobiota bacterium]